MAETALPFLYQKVAVLLKDETACPTRDFRITKKDLRIVRGELAKQGVVVIHHAGRKKHVALKL